MMNYHDTFIRVAPDCPVSEAVVPTGKREDKSIPQVEYELLAENPYTFTQEELLFAVHVRRQGIGEGDLKTRRARSSSPSLVRACGRPCSRRDTAGGCTSTPQAGSPSWRSRATSTGRLSRARAWRPC